MLYFDKIYGNLKIEEPVILDLINSKAIQRLQGVDQLGYFKPFFSNGNHTRFEHSMGDYWLLNKFNASLEEQISGLIHDVSHTAFSHCVDFVLNKGNEHKQNFQDENFHNYIKTTEIPEILNKYNYDLKIILNEENFPLQETKLPDICADRIDYSLRSLVAYNEISRRDVNDILQNLTVIENKWVFKNLKIGKKFAELFTLVNDKYYSGLVSALMFKKVADYLEYALNRKYIIERDLFLTDNEVIDKINKFLENDNELKLIWNRMNNKDGLIEDKNNYDCVVNCKSRVINPLVLYEDKIVRLSEVINSWGKIVEEKSKPKVYYLKYEN